MNADPHRQPPARPRPACRASTAIRPEHVAPAIDALLADADEALERVTATRMCRPTTTRCRPCSTSPPSACGRAWGAVSHLNAVADTPELRAAYNASLPQGHRVLDPPRRRRAAVRQVQGDGQSPRRSALNPASASALWPTRCATSCCRAPNCRATAKERFAADPGRGRPSWARSLLRARARRHRRLRLLRHRRRTGRRAGRRAQAARAAAAGRGPATATSSRCTCRSTCR